MKSLVVLLALALGGCANTKTNFVQVVGAKCNALGFKTGSVDYENCMMIHADARGYLAAEDREQAARSAARASAVPHDAPGDAIQKNINGMCATIPSCKRGMDPDELENLGR
jgi:hypothetical protein